MSKIEPLKKAWVEVGKPPKGSGNALRIDIQMAVTPIFDRDVGHRMKIARMRMLMSQGELGRHFGLSQHVIGMLESGKIATARQPFTLARFNAIFGDMSSYILRGANAGKYDAPGIQIRYWDTRLKRTPRKNGRF